MGQSLPWFLGHVVTTSCLFISAATQAVIPNPNVNRNRKKHACPHRRCADALTVSPHEIAAVQNPFARWYVEASTPIGYTRYATVQWALMCRAVDTVAAL